MFALGHLRSSICKLKKSRTAGWCLAAAWIVSILVGLKLLVDFDMTPGATGSPPANCPPAVSRTTRDTRPLLIMFVHPNCPCSRASLAELNSIVEASPGTFDLRIYVRTPVPESAGPKATTLWQAAAAISGATLIDDPDGQIASRCQIRTSGHVLLYSATGELLFTGGITAARGHGGENPGRTAVLELLAGRRAAEPQHVVFGCPLFDPTSSTTNESSCPAQK